MGGAWLGEKKIPAVAEDSPGVYTFSHYRETKLRPRLIVFGLLFGFASLLCIPAIVFSFHDRLGFLVILAFYITVGAMLGLTVFGHSEYLIDTNTKAIANAYYVFGRRISRRSRQMAKYDHFVVYLFVDAESLATRHIVYANISGIDRLFVKIHLPTRSRSDDLIRWLNSFANKLEARPAKYETLWVLWAHVLTLRSRAL